MPDNIDKDYPTSLLDAISKGKASISPNRLETISQDDPVLRQLTPQQEVKQQAGDVEQRLSYIDKVPPGPSIATKNSQTTQETTSLHTESPWVRAARSGTLDPAINGGTARDSSDK